MKRSIVMKNTLSYCGVATTKNGGQVIVSNTRCVSRNAFTQIQNVALTRRVNKV